MLIAIFHSSLRPHNCKSTATISSIGRIQRPPGIHSHLPEVGGFARAVRGVLEKTKDVMHERPRSNPTEELLAQKRTIPSEQAAYIKPASKVRTLRKHAASEKPDSVSSLQDIHNYISGTIHPGYTVTVDGEEILSIPSAHGGLVLTTRRMLASLRDARMLQADATYKVVQPKFEAQLFTIHANWGTHVRTIELTTILSPIPSLGLACSLFSSCLRRSEWSHARSCRPEPLKPTERSTSASRNECRT